MLYICTQHNTVFLYCPKNDNVFRGIFSAFPLIVVGEVDLRYFTHKSRYDCARMALGRWRLSSVLGLLHRSDLLFFGRRCTYSHSTHSSFIFYFFTLTSFFFFFLTQCGFFKRAKYEDKVPSYNAVRIKREDRDVNADWPNLEKKSWVTRWHDNEHYS